MEARGYSLSCIQKNVGQFDIGLALGFLHRVNVNSVVDVSEQHAVSVFKVESLNSAITTSVRSFTYEYYLKDTDPHVPPRQSVSHLLE